MKAIVDRIEEEIVTLEVDYEYINFPLNKFPEEIKEGDVVWYENGIFNILLEETLSREKEIRNLFDSLLDKNSDI